MDSALCVSSSLATDPGAARRVNQDAVLERRSASPEDLAIRGTIWVISDGVGSQDRGAHASHTAAEIIIDTYWSSPEADPAERIRVAIDQANTALLAENQSHDGKRDQVGATILVCAIVGERLYTAHAGRSRAYLYRDGAMRQLTNDHTWVAEQIRAGSLSPDEVATHPRRNVVTRALGVRSDVKIDTSVETLASDDLVLLCSDGLYRALDDVRIALLLQRFGADAAPLLVDEAKRLGARDNVTAVTAAIETCPDSGDQDASREPGDDRFGMPLAVSLDFGETLRLVMQRLLTISGAERAVILTVEPDGTLAPQVMQSAGESSDDFSFSRAVTEQALATGSPVVVTNAADDPRFREAESIVERGLQKIIAVPLLAGLESIGVLYVESSADGVQQDGIDVDLLQSFGAQAAAAIKNARLHQALVERSHDLEVARRRQDTLFRSLGSALVAIDTSGHVTDWNPAAEEILGIDRDRALGKSFSQLVPQPLAAWLSALVAQAEYGSQTILTSDAWEGSLSSRPRAVLTARVARLRDLDGQTFGFVFVITDRTDYVLMEEARHQESNASERMRMLFSRYLAPSLVERLLSDQAELELGGFRKDVSILFADIRGFTGYSEQRNPEEVVAVLNGYLSLATAEIFGHYGTLDKFLGDGVMAIFGAPLDVPNHELAAVRAAASMISRLEQLRRDTGARIGFGVGINSGPAIVGNIGTPQLMNYTAIGDVVNVAARLQAEARTGEVLLGETTVERIAEHIDVEELGPLYVKGRGSPVKTYKLIRLLDSGDGQ